MRSRTFPFKGFILAVLARLKIEHDCLIPSDKLGWPKSESSQHRIHDCRRSTIYQARQKVENPLYWPFLVSMSEAWKVLMHPLFESWYVDDPHTRSGFLTTSRSGSLVSCPLDMPLASLKLRKNGSVYIGQKSTLTIPRIMLITQMLESSTLGSVVQSRALNSKWIRIQAWKITSQMRTEDGQPVQDTSNSVLLDPYTLVDFIQTDLGMHGGKRKTFARLCDA